MASTTLVKTPADWVNSELRLQRCQNCGFVRYPPSPLCPSCNHQEFACAHASGRGVLYSYSTIYRPLNSTFKDLVPYSVGIVRLDEGPLLEVLVNYGDSLPRFINPLALVRVEFVQFNDHTVPCARV